MKRISVFIGSSIDEMKEERLELKYFGNELAIQYIDQGYFIDFYGCEEILNRMTIDGSQEIYDTYIREKADLCVFLFGKQAGQYTLHELMVAAKNGTRPDIMVFFSMLRENEEDYEKACSIVKEIMGEKAYHTFRYWKTEEIKDAIRSYLDRQKKSGGLQ